MATLSASFGSHCTVYLGFIIFFMLEALFKLFNIYWIELLDTHSYKNEAPKGSLRAGLVSLWASLRVNQVNQIQCPICRRISKMSGSEDLMLWEYTRASRVKCYFLTLFYYTSWNSAFEQPFQNVQQSQE